MYQQEQSALLRVTVKLGKRQVFKESPERKKKVVEHSQRIAERNERELIATMHI
jgi:hypothetical protein